VAEAGATRPRRGNSRRDASALRRDSPRSARLVSLFWITFTVYTLGSSDFYKPATVERSDRSGPSATPCAAATEGG